MSQSGVLCFPVDLTSRCSCLTSHPVHAYFFYQHRRLQLHKPVLKRCGAVVMTSRASSAQVLQAELQNLCESIKAFADAKPSVTGSERLLKRAQRDCWSVKSLHENAEKARSAGSTEDELAVSPSQDLQGVRNNLRGLQAELDLAWQAEAVVCLGAKFYSNVSAGVYCVDSIMYVLIHHADSARLCHGHA